MNKEPRIVYLDHAATTPVRPEVLAVMQEVNQKVYGNASAMYELGREAARILADARARVAKVLEVLPEEIIFTGSGTESDNLAVLGVARACKEKGKHVVISSIEHKAILAAADELEAEGFAVTRVNPQSDGLIKVEDILDAVREDTVLVSIMYANNEIGTVEPIADIAAGLSARGATRPYFHTDACQAVGYLPLSPVELGVDLMTINGSKIYGPKGVGVLYIKKDVPLRPLIVGGDQESHRRAGTENIALAVGMATALELAVTEMDTEASRLLELRDYFIKQITERCSSVFVNGHAEKRLPNNVHLTVPDLEGESMVLWLDENDICAATGSACSALDLNPSHVLRAIGISDDYIHGSLRFTLGHSTTKEDIDYTVEHLSLCIETLSAITATTAMRTKYE